MSCYSYPGWASAASSSLLRPPELSTKCLNWGRNSAIRCKVSSFSCFFTWSQASKNGISRAFAVFCNYSRHWISMPRMRLLPITPCSNGSFYLALWSILLSTVIVSRQRRFSSSLSSGFVRSTLASLTITHSLFITLVSSITGYAVGSCNFIVESFLSGF